MKHKKPHIFILIDWFLPGYKAGGPIQSTSNLIRAFEKDYTFSVVTKNVDHTSTEPYTEVESDTWTEYEGIPVYYFSDQEISYASLRKLIQEQNPDFVYLNSMYSLPFTIWPLWMKFRGQISAKVVLAPRGMLQAGAMKVRFLKKKVFLTLMRLTGVQRKIIWQATDDQEKQDIARFFGKELDIRIAPNIPRKSKRDWETVPKKEGEVRFVFTSRISRKKNIEFFLERLKNVKGKVLFDIYGPAEDEEYLQICKKTASELPDSISVQFKGPIPAPELPELIRSYHFSVLTTRAENFGHAIFEGLVEGKPVLISDQTPWRNLESQKAGWDIPLNNLEKHEEIIQFCINMGQETYDEWSRAAWQYARDFHQAPDLLEKTRFVFH